MPEQDEEFATAEDLAMINANPSLLKAYNAMKAGVTKKFQTYSQEKKSLQETLSAYEQTLAQWEEWRPIIESYNADEQHPNPDNNGGKGKGKSKGNGNDDFDMSSLSKTFMTREELAVEAKKITDLIAQQKKMLDFSLQLDTIRRQHFNKYPDVAFDDTKILNAALERGYSNLEDAYTNVYREDFVKKEVDSQVKQRVEEELAKQRTAGETGSGSTSTTFKPPTEAPKTFSQASAEVLNEIRSGTLNKEIK
jgi:hypothetical protein